MESTETFDESYGEQRGSSTPPWERGDTASVIGDISGDRLLEVNILQVRKYMGNWYIKVGWMEEKERPSGRLAYSKKTAIFKWKRTYLFGTLPREWEYRAVVVPAYRKLVGGKNAHLILSDC